MNDWFEWNGVRCTDYGIHVSQHPPLAIPTERVTFTNIPGRSGSLTTLEGDDVYEDLVLTVECFIADASRIPDIATWLKGSGTVTFATRQGGFYNARVVNQINFEKILRGNPHRAFAINFRCKPFWYASDVAPITLSNSSTFLNNPSSVSAEPIVTVYGSGDITLMVGMTITELIGISGSITLDTPLMEAYQGVTSMNNCMSGSFPVLASGYNPVSWFGNVTKVEIQPNWRYL